MTSNFDLLDCDSLPTDDAEHNAEHKAQVEQRRMRLALPRNPSTLHDQRAGARFYQADLALRMAINTALAVEMPLLVTGQAGTGKTQVAFFIAEAFGLELHEPLNVRSTTTIQDLLYRFDAVQYFHAAHCGEKGCMDRSAYVTPSALWTALVSAEPCVMLIDEIDKAPRDLPNDLLHVLDQYRFTVPELRGTQPDPSRLPGLHAEGDEWEVCGDRERRAPIIVITSNSERRLPEPFLRRCIFHHIEMTRDLVDRAVEARREREFRDLDAGTIKAAKRCVWSLREMRLRKKPSVGELLVWLRLLNQDRTRAAQLDEPPAKWPFLSALLKDQEDLQVARKAARP